MRWTNLTADSERQARLPGYRDGAVVRHFDAPEALDMRFYEVMARSVLNRVPASSRMPFRWTINPYRGCSHACVYCLGPDTRILMADGRRRRLADVQVGEAIYGTVREGSQRRLAVTKVLDKWSSLKPAWAIALEDETVLVASADHRLLTNLGWRHVRGSENGTVERPHLAMGSMLIGLRGALGEPAEHGLVGRLVEARPRLRVASIHPLGRTLRMYDLSTGTEDFIAEGVVSHNCFARPTHTYLGFDAGRDFEREIVVKVNAPEILRGELARASWKGEHVAMGTNTDPYQWVEGRYRLMDGIWEALRDAGNPCSVLTKSPLLLRDLPLMLEIAQRAEITANLSIPTLDERAWRETEPHTPNPRARLEAVAELNRAGIPTGVLVAPLMPGINDSPRQLEPLLDGAIEAGARKIGGVALHLRGEVNDVFMDWLRRSRPELVDRYGELYGDRAYAPPRERQRLAGLVRERLAGRSDGRPFRLVRPPPRTDARAGAGRVGVDEDGAVRTSPGRAGAGPAAGQQSLF